MTAVDEFDLVEERGERRAPVPERRRRGGPWLWAALAVVLVVAGIGAAPDRGLVIGAGTEQRPAAGIIDADLTAPPTAAWSTSLDDGVSTGASMLRRVGDVLVLVPDSVTGFDAATGERIWALPAPAGVCSGTTRVVCTVPSAGDGAITSIDPATGETATVWIPAAVYAVAVDDTLVVATDLDDGHVMAVDGDGETLWDTPLDAAVVGSDGAPSWLPTALIGDVLVVGGPVTYAVDTRTGEPQPHPGQWGIWDTPFGTRVDSGDPDDPARYLIDAHGRPAASRGGGMSLRVDDGVGGDILLEMNGPLLTATSADGYDLWSVPNDEDLADARIATFPMARLAGVVIAAGLGDVVTVSAHDLITGEELWRLSEGSWPDTFAGSGTTLLRLENQAEIVAIDVRSGEELWRLDVGSIQGAVAMPDGLVLWTPDGLTRWVWP